MFTAPLPINVLISSSNYPDFQPSCHSTIKSMTMTLQTNQRRRKTVNTVRRECICIYVFSFVYVIPVWLYIRVKTFFQLLCIAMKWGLLGGVQKDNKNWKSIEYKLLRESLGSDRYEMANASYCSRPTILCWTCSCDETTRDRILLVTLLGKPPLKGMWSCEDAEECGWLRIVPNEVSWHCRCWHDVFSCQRDSLVMNIKTGARGSVVGWGTMLQVGRSRIRFLMISSDFSIVLIFPVALWPWGRLCL
jgi:hypothetical protein